MTGTRVEEGAAGPTAAVTLRRLAPSVFLPALVYEIGNGAIAPIIALTALDEGASPGLAGLLLAALGVGQVLGDIPAGALADRIGDRHAMVGAAGLAMVALIACATTHSLAVLACALLVIGAGNATFYLGRQSYLNDVVAPSLRARAMSTLGGSHRIGLFIGPFIGAGAIGLGGIRSAFVVAVCAAATASMLLLVIPDAAGAAGHAPATRGSTTSWAMLCANRKLFATLGLAVVLVGAVRAARQTVLPLWSSHIGLGPEQTSIIFGIASAVDMALFYPAGRAMDRWGRVSVAVPAMALIGGAMVCLPLAGSAGWLAADAMVMSLGNGIGTGIMMTIGADAAPQDGRVRFLAVWRLFSDSGNAAGPVVVSAVAGVATLAAGISTIGTAGLLAAAALARWVPRYSAFATRASTRAHRARVDA